MKIKPSGKFFLTIFILYFAISAVVPAIYSKKNKLKLNTASNQSLPPVVISALNLPSEKQSSFSTPDKPIYLSVKNNETHIASPVFLSAENNWPTIQNVIALALDYNLSPAANEETAIKLWRYISDNVDPDFSPFTDEPSDPVNNPLILLNSFGYGACGNISSTLAIIAKNVGFDSRVINLNNHAVTEIFYDGGWHMFDSNLKIVIRDKNNSVAGVEDIFKNPKLLNQLDGRPERYPGSNKILKEAFNKEIQPIIISVSEIINSLQPMVNNFRTKLKPGEEIRYYFDWQNKYFWKKFNFNRETGKINGPLSFANGLMISPVTAGNNLDESILELSLPYPMLSAYIYGRNICNENTTNNILLSYDGINWLSKISNDCNNDLIGLSNLFPVGSDATIINKYYLKLPSTNEFTVFTQFQFSPKLIQHLMGPEKFTPYNHPNEKSLSVRLAYPK